VRVDVSIGGNSGNGSGLVVDNETVLTCYHVIRPNGQQPDRIEIVDANGTHPAEIIRVDQYRDVAIIRSAGLRGSCTFKRFAEVEVGDQCLVFGFPLNMPNLSVLQAMVSAKGRLIMTNYPYDCIQVDGRVNRGNSGGPVVDISSGNVVGIVTAKYIPFLRGIEDLQDFVRRQRLPTNRGGVTILGVDFVAFFNALFQIIDQLAGALQLVQVGIGYVIPVDGFTGLLAERQQGPQNSHSTSS